MSFSNCLFTCRCKNVSSCHEKTDAKMAAFLFRPFTLSCFMTNSLSWQMPTNTDISVDSWMYNVENHNMHVHCANKCKQMYTLWETTGYILTCRWMLLMFKRQLLHLFNPTLVYVAKCLYTSKNTILFPVLWWHRWDIENRIDVFHEECQPHKQLKRTLIKMILFLILRR